MSDDVFDGQMLADKLSKLNSSQQSIESLSRSCISHKKKAKQIVEIWHKSFKTAQRDQQVSFLYLANDILQNSRRKGSSEFVNEFWKVVPSALKHVNEHGGENGKTAASRLVDIWNKRRVFGSWGQNLKDEVLGKSPLPQLPTNGKTSNPIKIAKRDASSLRLKLAVGCIPEKIITAFHSLHDENATEDTALNNCEGALRRFGDLERDIASQGKGVLPGSSLLDELQEQENVLQDCVNQLETAERTRTSLVSQLKEALQDQESKLDVIQSQLKVARHQIDHAVNLRKKVVSSSLPSEATSVDNPASAQSVPTGTAQSVPTGTTTHATEEENKKAAAAAMAAKLAASTSSAQMLSSVLSSLVAEEAASVGNGFNSSGFTSSSSVFPPEKRPKLETPTSIPDLTNSDVSSGYFTSIQTSFPPPPQSIGGTSSPANQFAQSSGLMMGGMPYPYVASSLPPPPPMPQHMAMGMMRPTNQPPPQQQQQQQQQQQAHPQQPSNGGYYRPPGIGFYGQNHQPSPPPVPRQ